MLLSTEFTSIAYLACVCITLKLQTRNIQRLSEAGEGAKRVRTKMIALVLRQAGLQEEAPGNDVALHALRQQRQRHQPRRRDRQRELRDRQVPPQRLLALLRRAGRLPPQLPVAAAQPR